VKLTMPAIEQGLRSIMVDGTEAGWAYTVWDDRDHWQGGWEARLLADPGDLDSKAEIVRGFRLRDLRAELQRRLEVDGPWWSG
jgi:hypothetical protein